MNKDEIDIYSLLRVALPIIWVFIAVFTILVVKDITAQKSDNPSQEVVVSDAALYSE